ncbi:MAG TPA: MAPEG family protein [Caldimonas sp.]|jgi:uncharacterized MAPEG superfamily protein|nr:MAPEG family protein [Caldimonas sp.]
MKTELFYLLLTAILTGVLWIPVVIGYATSRGPLKPEDYVVAPSAPLPAWVNRANRAHLNAVENIAPFVAVVLIAQVVGVSTSLTATCAAIYFYARLVHAVVHITGFKQFMARTIAFTVAWLAFMTYAVVVLMRAM